MDIEQQIVALLEKAADRTIFGEIEIANTSPDDVLDAIFSLERAGRIEGKFRPNANRRSGSDFGWVRLRW
jgi:hypothetical protein